MFFDVKVNSSAINKIIYDSSSKVLGVEFKQGRLYNYYDVPEEVFNEFITADSKGKYFNREIKKYAI